MPESPSYDVFVSYAEADRAWVEGYLLAALEQAGVRCMYESAFALGVPRLLEFQRAIQQSKRTLLVISPDYLADGLNEFIATMGQAYGQENNIWPVIPLIRQFVPLPPGLGMLRALKATTVKEQESAIVQLCADLKRPTPAPAPPPDCPYPGMKPFSLGDRDRFFGREEEIKQLLEHLRLHPFITVIGPSGSGKSSLVFAGLIPALRESRLFGSGGWQIQWMRPGESPETTLKQALASGAQQKAARMLLVVDQFEELFTLAKEEAVPFQESLLKLVATPNVYLVLTVRADFYADLMTSLLWQEIQNYRLEVVPLTETGLEQAILRPAATVGVFVEAALVEKLVTDAAREPGVLPLIQETLVLLWQGVERRFLPLTAYEALVLPRSAYGQKTGLQVAIAQRADQAIKELSDEPEKQQAIARRIFLRLIQFGEGRADTRRQQTVEALRAATDDPTLFNKTLTHLVKSRLLTPSGDDKTLTRKIDLAHEALIAGWPTLQQWITERRAKEEVRRRLTIKAEEWERFGRGSGGLLDLVALSEAEGWLSSPDAYDLGYDEVLPALISTSREVIEEAERQKQQAERQKQEQAQRELKLTQDRLQEEKKARKSLQGMLAAVGLTGALAIGFAIYMFRQSVNNQIQTITSRSEALLASHKDFDALIEELKATQLAKRWLWLLRNNADISVAATLQQALYQVRERNQLLSHKLSVRGVSFSPDNNLIASGSDDNKIQLWNQDGSLLGKPLEGHTDAITDISFSPSKTDLLLASASQDSTIRLWKVDGSPLKTLIGHIRKVTNLSFSRETEILASASLDGTVRLWNAQNGQPLKTLKFADPDKVSNAIVSFSPNGNYLAVSMDGGEIQLWQLDKKAGKTQMQSNQISNVDFIAEPRIKAFATKSSVGGIAGINFSPDNTKLAAVGDDETVKIWTLGGSKPIRTLELKPNQDETASKFSENRLWSMRVKFSPDGQTLATNTNSTEIRLWDLNNRISTLLHGHSDGVSSIDFSPDSKKLISGGMDNSVRVWDLAPTSTNIVRFGIGFDPLTEKFALDNTETGTKIIEDLPTHSKVELKGSTTTQTVTFSPNGKLIAGANNDWQTGTNVVQLWNTDGSPRCPPLKGHTEVIVNITFSSDGKRLVSTGENTPDVKTNNVAILWDVESCHEIARMNEHKSRVNVAKFSPNNDLIATASADSTARLWNANDHSKSIPLIGHKDEVRDVSFSPDGQKIATASADSTIRIWDRQGSTVGSPLKGHVGKVDSVAFSPDGRILASGGEDGTVRLWDNNGQALKVLELFKKNAAVEVSFSLDSNFLYVREKEEISEGNVPRTKNTITRLNLDLTDLSHQSCDWIQDYLKNSGNGQSDGLRSCEKDNRLS